MSPQRIQRKRTKGWRMPEGAVYVGRPGQWGNPFVIGETYITAGLVPWPVPAPTHRDPGTYDNGLVVQRLEGPAQAVAWYHGAATEWAQHDQRFRDGLSFLRGRDLACWCPLAQPCHADVLIDLANRETPTALRGTADKLEGAMG